MLIDLDVKPPGRDMSCPLMLLSSSPSAGPMVGDVSDELSDIAAVSVFDAVDVAWLCCCCCCCIARSLREALPRFLRSRAYSQPRPNSGAASAFHIHSQSYSHRIDGQLTNTMRARALAITFSPQLVALITSPTDPTSNWSAILSRSCFRRSSAILHRGSEVVMSVQACPTWDRSSVGCKHGMSDHWAVQWLQLVQVVIVSFRHVIQTRVGMMVLRWQGVVMQAHWVAGGGTEHWRVVLLLKRCGHHIELLLACRHNRLNK